MSRSVVSRALFAIACGVLIASCGSSNPTTPSLNLAGSWRGTQHSTGSTDGAMQVTWTATQSGSTLSGPLVFTFSNSSTITGTMTGTIAGNQVSLNETFAAGSFAALGSSTCSATATGTATPNGTTLSATMTVTFAAACVGTITETATESDSLSLTKQ